MSNIINTNDKNNASNKKKYSKKFILELEDSPLDTLDKYNYLEKKKLERLILDAKDTYYNNSNLLVLTDSCFDILIEILETKYPKSKLLDVIGSNLANNALNKVKLPYHLGSMSKIKPGSRNLELWFDRYNKGYVVSEKLDGLSGLLVISLPITSSNSDKLNKLNKLDKLDKLELMSKLYTRGDGDIGQDISHLIPFLKFLKGDNNNSLVSSYNEIKKYLIKNNLQSLAIRGELICTKDKFDKYYKNQFPKIRSLVAGVVNSKAESFSNKDMRTKAKHIDFVSYQIIHPPLKVETYFHELSQKLNFKTAYYEVKDKLTPELCQSLLLDFKSKSDYEIDGIIITDNSKIHVHPTEGNPKYSVAFKMALEDTQSKETVVEYVEYNVSKNSILKPRIKYKPIVVGGDNLIYTSGFNAKYIKDNLLGPGSRIVIIKSGDVIPYIYKVLSPSKNGKWQEPDIKWHWNDSNVDAVIDNKSDLPMEKVLLQFFNQFDIVGLKEGVITKLVNAGFDTINGILRLKVESLLDVEGFQLKSSKKIVEQIQNKIVNTKHPLDKLLVGSNIFPNFAIKKIKLITDNFEIRDILDLKITEDMLTDINGIGNITANDFIENIPAFNKWLNNIPLLKLDMDNKNKKSNKKGENGKKGENAKDDKDDKVDMYINGKKILFTGFRDKELEAYIENNNGTVQSSISGTTDLLIAKDINESSSKIIKARDKGINILTLDEFLQKINY